MTTMSTEPTLRYVCKRCGAESPRGIGYYAGTNRATHYPAPADDCPGPHLMLTPRADRPYVGADGQRYVIRHCHRTDCTTWDGRPIQHGWCNRCQARTHRGLLGYSWGEANYGCSQCAVSDGWVPEHA